MLKSLVSWRQVAIAVAVAICASGSVAVRADNVEKPWDNSVALGLSISRGNSHSETFNGSVMGTKLWTHDELRLQADTAYGITGSKKSAETLHGLAQWNHLFTERWYSALVAEGLHDGVASIAYRVTIAPNVGYYFIKSDKTKLSGETGPGFIINKENGQSETAYVTLRVADRFERKLSETAKLWQSTEWLPKVDDFSNYLLNTEIGIEAAINKAFSVRVVGTDRYNSQPAKGRKYNDILLVSSLAYKF